MFPAISVRDRLSQICGGGFRHRDKVASLSSRPAAILLLAMCSCRLGTLLCTLILAQLVCSRSSAQVGETSSLAMFMSDDECRESDSGCALNALQRKAGLSSKSEAELQNASAMEPTSSTSEDELQDGEAELGASRRKIMTLYHQTSPSIGKLILQSGFKPGHLGWCGAGIYFAMTPQATTGKIKGPDSHHGFMIEAKVDVGRVKHMSWRCTTKPSCNHHPFRACQDRTNRGSWLKNQGYNSIAYTPDPYGQEIVIYDKNQVVSMRGYSYHR